MPVSRSARPRLAAHPRLVALLASTALVGVAPALAQGLPTGGRVVSGGVAIGTPTNGALAITQSSQNAIVNWQGFSIGQGNRVDIAQPNSQAAILNRVTGNTRSTIAGQLNATGQVYLVNPNGITITRSGRVNAGGGFVASTLGISDDDFKAGRRRFRGAGGSASVVNHGTITVARGGYAALIGGRVSNIGTITVPMGHVGLGSGERATLDLSGDGFLQVQVPTTAKGRGALVSNAGTISADGGAVTLTAAAARDMARQAVNLSGTIEARSVAGHNGRVTLSGGEGAVRVTSTARIDASGAGAENGGRVRVTGRHLAVAGTVDVSGGRGGRVALRGSEHLALSGHILAAGRTGRGGRVTATAPAITMHAALIDASGATGGGSVHLGGGYQGGGRLAHARTVAVDAATTLRADALTSGHGGSVVVWSDAATRFAGTITARGGAGGGDGGQAEVSSHGVLAYTGFADLTAARGSLGTLLLDPYNVTISTGTDANQSGFTASGNDSVINSTTLQTALATANVTVSTGASGTQAGTITLAANTPLAWNTGATLTLQAAGAVTLNSTITAAAGGLTIAAGTGTSTATAAVSVARFTLASGDWVQNAATLPGFAAGDFQVADGASFLRAAGGAGTSASPYLLTDIYGVQGMGSSAAYRAASYRLANDVDASGTAAWNGGLGFSPVGNTSTPFTGSLDGAGHTITGLTIVRPSQNDVGLIGYLGPSGSVSGLGLVGGSVSGSYYVGGLVGYSFGTVSQSYASGTVSGSTEVGGLVGFNTGTVSQSYASGTVSGSVYVGGLVGINYGTVSQSYASGSVSGSTNVGGLVGSNYGGTLTNAYWDTQTTGQANGVGVGSATGATGLTTAQARTSAAYAGFDFGAVWYQAGDMRPILRSEAAAPVSGVIPVSNLHQLQLMGANLAGSYRLTANLDATATNATAASPGVWGAGGFVPVGDNSNRFTGSLDGAGHTITGLTIVRPNQNYVGLIGMLGARGRVNGLGLVGDSVSGGDSVGGLVGWSFGTVSQSYASGSISGSTEVGGLVGASYGTVSQSYATVSVSGSNDFVGGLVGYNANGGQVSQSYASGSVSGRGDVGGLVGYSSGTVSQSYATGSVSGSANVGGLVGDNGGTVTNAYWDTQTTGQANGVGYGSATGATGLTTAQARTSAAYAGFDFGAVWYQAGDMRPILRSEAAAPVSGVIAVSNLHQLQLMGANLAGSYRLTTNLDATATNATAASSGVWGAGGFVPVGTRSAAFTGSLDGAGHTITGLTIARPSWDDVGLIGVLGAGGRVSGLGLVGGSVSGHQYVGDLVGESGGTVSQSYASGTVSGTYEVGGLVGYSTGAMSQSYASGTVSGGNDVGGLVGENDGTVSQSYASGSVSVSGSNTVGGLVGYNAVGTLTNAYWDTQTTGQANGVGYGSATGATGLTTAQMQDLAAFRTNYAGFDFAGVWAPPNQVGQNNNSTTAYYPQLYALSNVVAVTPGATTRTYGSATPPATPPATYAGVQAGSFVTTLGTFTTTAGPTANVGTYAISGSGIAVTSAVGSLYRIVAVPGTLTVTPATITVTGATGVNKTYDATTALASSATGFTSSGVLFNDAVTVSAAATAYDSANAGSRSVLVSGLTLSGAGAGNYVLSGTSVTGSGTISPATLTYVAGAASRTYGAANPALTGTVTGFVAGQTQGSATTGTPGFGTAANSATNVGSYAVTGSGLTANNGNYIFVQAAGNASALTVTPAPLTVTGAKTYDATTAFGTSQLAVAGAQNGETVTLTQGSGTAASANAGTYAGSALSGLAIQVGGGNAAAGNYSLPTAGTLVITPATITVTANGGSSTYGDVPTNPGLSATGLQGGQGVGVLTGLSNSFGLGPTANVGTYALSVAGTLTNGNYTIATRTGGSFTVGQRPITLTADAQSRVYGDANPGLTYTVGGRGLANGDGLTGGLATAATPASGVGSYAIGQGSLAASANYAVSYVGANLTIGQRPITLTADAQSRVYGDANPALTYTVGGRGLANGDGLTGGLTTAATPASDVGSYAIGQGSLAASANYAVTYVGANLTVGQRPLTIVVDPQSRSFGEMNPVLTYTIGGRGLVNGDTLTGALSAGVSGSSRIGSYGIGLGTLTASANYSLTLVGASFSITPAPVESAGLASTVDRSIRLDRIPAGAEPTFVLGLGADGGLPIVDPRFDQPLACLMVAGGCFVSPAGQRPVTPQAVTSGRQASARGAALPAR